MRSTSTAATDRGGDNGHHHHHHHTSDGAMMTEHLNSLLLNSTDGRRQQRVLSADQRGAAGVSRPASAAIVNSSRSRPGSARLHQHMHSSSSSSSSSSSAVNKNNKGGSPLDAGVQRLAATEGVVGGGRISRPSSARTTHHHYGNANAAALSSCSFLSRPGSANANQSTADAHLRSAPSRSGGGSGAPPFASFAEAKDSFGRVLKALALCIQEGAQTALALERGMAYYCSDADSYSDMAVVAAAGPSVSSSAPSPSPSHSSPTTPNLLKILHSPRSRAVIYTGKSLEGLTRDGRRWVRDKAAPMLEALTGEEVQLFMGEMEKCAAEVSEVIPSAIPCATRSEGLASDSAASPNTAHTRTDATAAALHSSIRRMMGKLSECGAVWSQRWARYQGEVKALSHPPMAPIPHTHHDHRGGGGISGGRGIAAGCGTGNSSGSGSLRADTWALQTLLMLGLAAEGDGGNKGTEGPMGGSDHATTVGRGTTTVGRRQSPTRPSTLLAGGGGDKDGGGLGGNAPTKASAASEVVVVTESPRLAAAKEDGDGIVHSSSAAPPPPPPPHSSPSESSFPPILNGILQPTMYATIKAILAHERRTLRGGEGGVATQRDAATAKGRIPAPPPPSDNTHPHGHYSASTARGGSSHLLRTGGGGGCGPTPITSLTSSSTVVVTGTKHAVPICDWPTEGRIRQGGIVGQSVLRTVRVGGSDASPSPSATATPQVVGVWQPSPQSPRRHYAEEEGAGAVSAEGGDGGGRGARASTRAAADNSMGRGRGGRIALVARQAGSYSRFVEKLATANVTVHSGGSSSPRRSSPSSSSAVPTIIPTGPRPWSASHRSFSTRDTNYAASATLRLSSSAGLGGRRSQCNATGGRSGEEGPTSAEGADTSPTATEAEEAIPMLSTAFPPSASSTPRRLRGPNHNSNNSSANGSGRRSADGNGNAINTASTSSGGRMRGAPFVVGSNVTGDGVGVGGLVDGHLQYDQPSAAQVHPMRYPTLTNNNAALMMLNTSSSRPASRSSASGGGRAASPPVSLRPLSASHPLQRYHHTHSSNAVGHQPPQPLSPRALHSPSDAGTASSSLPPSAAPLVPSPPPPTTTATAVGGSPLSGGVAAAAGAATPPATMVASNDALMAEGEGRRRQQRPQHQQQSRRASLLGIASGGGGGNGTGAAAVKGMLLGMLMEEDDDGDDDDEYVVY